jgi:dipeptidase
MKIKKTAILIFIPCFIIIFFSAAAIEKKAHESNAQKQCTSIIVGKKATTDGSVLLGHNEDWGNYLKPLCFVPREKHNPEDSFTLKDGQKIPQVAETYAFIWPAAECNGINEHQVAIVDDTGSCREELFQKERGLDLEEFLKLALQRSKTAREAIQVMGKLIEKYGYRSHNGKWGDIFSIADANEGWWMEVTIGGLWAAQRVPDDGFVVLANRFRIGEVDLNDSSRFLGADNLISYATEKGWYNPEQGPFNFSQIYGKLREGREKYNTRREWRGNCLLAGKEFSEANNPLTVVSNKKLSAQDIMRVFRDHYEGTPYDLTDGYKKGSPHHTSERVICTIYTDASTVAQLRAWLPPEIGGILWLAVGTPCSSVYTPYYLACHEFPHPYSFVTKDYDRTNAFWAFNSLENIVDCYYARKMNKGEKEIRAIDFVAGYWNKFEAEEFALQEAVEKTALELHKKDKSLAHSFLEMYSNSLAARAYIKALELSDKLRSTYYQ